MRLFRKMKNRILEPEKSKKLTKWQSRLEKAKQAYGTEIAQMRTYSNYYDGERGVNGNPNNNKAATKVSVNVRNIVYELIETQVDSAIPMPKVTAIHEEDEELAKTIEKMLTNKIRTLNLHLINDLQERVVPVQGGDFMHIEWDKNKGLHTTVGDVVVSERHPKQVIPQPGVTEIENMDYIFILMSMTRDSVKRKYGVDVSEAEEEYPEIRTDGNDNKVAEDLVTVNMAYYRNSAGGIGLYCWCDDYTLVDMDDYQARKLEYCVKCGAVKDGDTCTCGSKKFEKRNVDYEERNGEQIPYYKPNCFPLVLRRNVSRANRLLGVSDVKVIEDQQDAIKKYGSKIQEKLLKGGSFVTLPRGVSVDSNDAELKILRLDNPSQKNLIDVINVQPTVTNDMNMLETNYQWAKSTLGITDSYQGKYDSSATSGTAKQYSINQAAGRLESKRTLKNNAFAKMYEMIFKYMLAYADEPVPVTSNGLNGDMEYREFNRYDFLKVDAAGEYYWDDEFLFETDPTSTLMANREALWQQADLKLQSGAFGQIGDLETNYMYWSFMEKSNYPNAGEIKRQIQARINQMSAQAAEQEVIPDEMSIMSDGNADIQNQIPNQG